MQLVLVVYCKAVILTMRRRSRRWLKKRFGSHCNGFECKGLDEEKKGEERKKEHGPGIEA